MIRGANAVLGAIGAACAGTIAYFGLQPFMWGDASLENWKNVLTGIAVVIAPTLYFHQMRAREAERRQSEEDEKEAEARRRCEERRSVAVSLYQSLGRIYLTLEGKTGTDAFMVIELDGRTAVFVNRHLSPDAYDSVIHGGRVHLMDAELWEAVAELYNRVKMHNHYGREAHQLMGEGGSDGTSKAAFHYGALMESEEKILLEEIPKLMQRLAEFKASLPF